MLKKIAKKIINYTFNKKQMPNGVVCFGDNVTIGNNVSFGGNVMLYKTAPINIGDHTMIAYDVKIHTSTHDYNYHPMWTWRIDRPVKIGKHVWIGIGAIIMPGVKIGNYAIIGAGSIVNAHVPECAIVAGNPARIIKYRDINTIKKNNSHIHKYPGKSVKKSFLDKEKKCKEKK